MFSWSACRAQDYWLRSQHLSCEDWAGSGAVGVPEGNVRAQGGGHHGMGAAEAAQNTAPSCISARVLLAPALIT